MPRAVEFAQGRLFGGFGSGSFLGGLGPLRAAGFAEIGRTAHLGHRRTDDVERNDPHGRGDPLAEYLRHTGLDVAHRFGVTLRQTPPDVVEIAAQYPVGVLVEDECHGADVYVYSLFHGRKSIVAV